MKSRVSKLLSVVWIFVLAAGLLQAPTSHVQAAPSELFFSEYIEGTSNNKALEIFNGTGVAVDLAAGGYNIQMFFNGSASPGTTINLTGVVVAGDVYVVAHSSANATILAQADQTNGSGWFNGNDAVVLRKGTTFIDVIGQVGFNPGTEWGTGLTSTADNTLRRKDTIQSGDPNGSDTFDPSIEWEGFATDTFDGLGSHTIIIIPDEVAPSITSTFPINGATGMPINANLIVNFSEPVNVIGTWFTLSCSVSGAVGAEVTGGPTSFVIDPTSNFADGESCTLTVLKNQISDQDTNDPPDAMLSDVAVDFTTVDYCALSYTPIYDIQGSGANAAITGPVVTQGVVVSDDEGPSPALRGFYLQDATGDDDQATSDGIFVYNGSKNNVNIGDIAYVKGTVSEYQDQTQISATQVVACSTGSVDPVDVTLPVPALDYLERYEGMLVRLPQTLYVTEHYQLGRFGQVVLSSIMRLPQPTGWADPGDDANALQALNNLNRIILDDSLNNQNPDPILFGRGGLPLSASNTLRGGDTITDLVGVMTYTWAGNSASPNAYRVRPINALGGGVPNFVAVNERPLSAPDSGGELKVAGMNLLNYFNSFTGCTNGVGGDSTDCRGAWNAAEFDRQFPKTVAAIVKTGADVVGLVELENDGYGSDSAIADLVDKLNAATEAGTYDYVDVDNAVGSINALGIDAIKVGLIYKPDKVTPVGTAVLNNGAFGIFDLTGGKTSPRNRPALAVTFEQAWDGARVTVVVNHLKSKGSGCEDNISPVQSDPDTGDLQGGCNLTRTAAAEELATWLATDPTEGGDEDVLILGDLNAYAKEDPVTALKTAGFTDLIDTFIGQEAYSYVFDGQWGYLDHALGSASLEPQVTGVVEYHINADEPSVLDYNMEYKTSGQLTSLYAPDEFRMADHDPVVVGLNLNVPPVVGAIDAPVDPVLLGTAITASADFTDKDVADTHTAVWDWGDGTTSNGTVIEADGSGSVEDSHTYDETGLYRITLTVTDLLGTSDESIFEYVVVYNPKAGFVTGSGWIDSPAGALTADPNLTGKAEFNFDSKYQKGAKAPVGGTELILNSTDFTFESDSYGWLVISGAKVFLSGTGTINGVGGYGFLLTAVDGDLNGSLDMFRIKIWNKADDSVIYDSMPGADDPVDPTGVVNGGTVVIHKGK